MDATLSDAVGRHVSELPTPCLLLDRLALERNLARLADHCRTHGLALRPHFKVHKSLDIVRRQLALGARGISVATLAEAEFLARAGVRDLLLTTQVAGGPKLARVVRLAREDPRFAVVADDAQVVHALQAAASAARLELQVFLDVYAGSPRAGCEPGAAAEELAVLVTRQSHLRLAGVQAYSGSAARTRGFEARLARSRLDLHPAVATVDRLRRAGIDVPIVTGGSTGTYDMDRELGLEELQAGSYALMDARCMGIGGRADPDSFHDFEPALALLATVIAVRPGGRATIDVGFKSSLRESDRVVGRDDVAIAQEGAEHGSLRWTSGPAFRLGDVVRILPTQLDATTNAFALYHVAENERVVDLWPIMGRGGPPQY